MKILCAMLLLIIVGLAIALHITTKRLKLMRDVMTEVGNMLKAVGEEAMKLSTALKHTIIGDNAGSNTTDTKEEKDNE